MHLASSVPRSCCPSSYRNCIDFARVNTLPYVFRKLRIHRNLTKRALAEKVLVSEEYVSQVEHCSRFPSLKYCLACGEEFGFNPEWIKVKWLNAVMERVNSRLMKRLGFDD